MFTLVVAPHADAVAATTYYACVKKRGGAIRLVARTTKCRHDERKISFNGQGVPGRNGLNGRNGTNGKNGTDGSRGPQGPQGPQGLQGPGATNFSAVLTQGSGPVQLAAVSNGIRVIGNCGPSLVGVSIETSAGSNLQVSGTALDKDALKAVDANNITTVEAVSGEKNADFDVIAREFSAPKFARIDVHGSAGSSCTFWGMIIPTS